MREVVAWSEVPPEADLSGQVERSGEGIWTWKGPGFLAWAAYRQWCLAWARVSDGQLSGLGRAGWGFEMLSSASESQCL